MAERTRRAVRIKLARSPAMTRSIDQRSGARACERLRIHSWCLSKSESASTERSPPAPNKRANVTIKWIKRMARPRTIRTVSTTSPLVSFGFRGNLRYELRIRHTLVSLWTMLKWLGIITRTLWSALHNHRALAVDRLNWLIRCPKQ